MGMQDQIRSLLRLLLTRGEPELMAFSQGTCRRIRIPGPQLGRSAVPPAPEDVVAILNGQVRDVSGQTRGLYAPLLASQLIPAMRPLPAESVLIFAAKSRSGSAAMRAWAAWLCQQAGEVQTATSLVEKILAEQSSEGFFHRLTVDTSLDAFVFDEFAAIHALYNLAHARQDPGTEAAVRRATLYHLANTQPDNTSQQPWALAAFAASADTRPMAEQQLHDATLYCQSHPGWHPVTCLLLGDALRTCRE